MKKSLSLLAAVMLFALAIPIQSFAESDAELFSKLKQAGGQSEIQETVILNLANGTYTCVQKRDGKQGSIASTKCNVEPDQDYAAGLRSRR